MSSNEHISNKTKQDAVKNLNEQVKQIIDLSLKCDLTETELCEELKKINEQVRQISNTAGINTTQEYMCNNCGKIIDNEGNVIFHPIDKNRVKIHLDCVHDYYSKEEMYSIIH